MKKFHKTFFLNIQFRNREKIKKIKGIREFLVFN